MLKLKQFLLSATFFAWLSYSAFSAQYVLYYARGAASLAPKMLLKSMDRTIDFEAVDLQTHTVVKDGSSYYTVNKTGMVPALLIRDEDPYGKARLLTETAVILQYFADQDPSNEFLPPVGEDERYFVLEKLNFIATEVHKSIGAWFGSMDKPFFSQKIKKSLSLLDEALKGQKFIANNKLSIADFYLTTALLEIKYFAKIDDLKTLKNLNKYLNRMRKIKDIREVLEQEGLIAWTK